MFDDLVGESKFKHYDEECDCDGNCAKGCDGNCASGCAPSEPCQPEAMLDEMPVSFCGEAHTDLKIFSLEFQISLKYEYFHNIQRFYMPKYAYECLENYSLKDSGLGVFRVQDYFGKFTKNNLRSIVIRRKNKQGKLVEFMELVELY